MTTVLGIDAAWTPTHPSGVALVQGNGSSWHCIAAAPSYDTFLTAGIGRKIDWRQTSFPGSIPDVGKLLRVARDLAGGSVDVVTIDMPVATVPFSCRRAADKAVSKQFGGRLCSAHSPTSSRPGFFGMNLSEAFRAANYPLATGATSVSTGWLLEVYPHPALLSLLKRSRRVQYKVSKAGKYWPDFTRPQRIEALVVEYANIHDALTRVFGTLNVSLPKIHEMRTLAHLKRYEDTLDALICAWVGVEFLARRTVALGDSTAAIWCPTDVVSGYN